MSSQRYYSNVSSLCYRPQDIHLFLWLLYLPQPLLVPPDSWLRNTHFPVSNCAFTYYNLFNFFFSVNWVIVTVTASGLCLKNHWAPTAISWTSCILWSKWKTNTPFSCLRKVFLDPFHFCRNAEEIMSLYPSSVIRSNWI